ncbi:MAG: SGNH/GDSL hydrolase family protein [Polyangiaceae bacterium]|nr:SGNH/GDSL hydrolase family protein [Polyangiaceae bacterium]
MRAAHLALSLLSCCSLLLACGGSDDEPGGSPGGSGGSGATGSGGSAGSASGGTGAGTGTGGGMTGPTTQDCFGDLYDGEVVVDYDQFVPTLGAHCVGTAHQDIAGVEKLVFLGDSITQGTAPTPSSSFYRVRLAEKLTQKFPGLEVQSCAQNGARARDLYTSGDQQIQQCFPGPESKKTLVVFTVGGNDLANLAQSKASPAQAQTAIDQVMTDVRAAIDYLKSPTNFPNGSYVVFANVYEYTDLTSNMSSCPAAFLAGLTGTWQEGGGVIKGLREGYMKIAVETGTDVMFMGEEFCGHGYEAKNTSGQCFRDASAENWFDATCIHPTSNGHAKIAELFETVIGE